MAKRKLALFKQDGEVYYITDSDAQSKLLEVNRKFSDYATTSELAEMDERLRSEINSAKFDGEYDSLKGKPDLSQYITEEKLNEKAYATKKELDDLKLETGTFTIDDETIGASSTYSSQKIHDEYALKSEIINDLSGYITKEELTTATKEITNDAKSLGGFAGTRCFKILYAKNDGDTGGTYVLDTIDGIEPGMTYNVIMSETKISWGAVISVGDHVDVEGQTPTNNGVRVSNYYNMPLNENDDDVHNIFYITGHPELGSHEIKKPSVSFGGFSPVEGTISTGTSSAAGKYSAAFGKKTIAGYQSISAGFESEAIGFTSAAFNQQNKVRSQAGFATGANNILKDHATAAFATGYNTVSDSEYQVVAGRFNKEVDGARVTGNGSDGNRKNIEQLDWDGNAWFAGDVYLGSTSGIEKDEGSISVLSEINDIKEVLEKNYYDITFSGLENCTAVDKDGNAIETGTPIVVKKFNGCYDFEFTPTANDGYEIGKDTDLIVAGTFESVSYSKKKGIYEIKNIGSNITCKLIARSGSEVGYNVTFAPINGEIIVCSTNDFNDTAETLSTDNKWTTQTRHKNTGIPTQTGTDEEDKAAAQVNFIVKPTHGYSVKNVIVDGTKKNVKGPDEILIDNGYSITQVGSDLTITVELEEINKTLDDYNIKNTYTKEEINSKLVLSQILNDDGTLKNKGSYTMTVKDGQKVTPFISSGITYYQLDGITRENASVGDVYFVGTVNGVTYNDLFVCVFFTNETGASRFSSFRTLMGINPELLKIKGISDVVGNDSSTVLSQKGLSDNYALKTEVAEKQDKLVSGISLKTINGKPLLGEGDIIITSSETPDLSGYATQSWVEAKGYLTEHQSLNEYALKIEIPTNISILTNDAGYITTAALDEYAKSTDIPTKTSQLTNDSNFLTEHQSLENYALKSEIPSIPTDISAFNNDIGYLTNIPNEYALKSEIPTKVSELTNDKGFIVEHQSLSGYAKEDWVISKGYAVASVVAEKYATKDSVPSIAGLASEEWVESKGYLTAHQDISGKVDTGTFTTEINKKANISDIPTKVSELTNDSEYATQTWVTDKDYVSNAALNNKGYITADHYSAGAGISIGSDGTITATTGFKISVVDSISAVVDANEHTLYLVKKDTNSSNNSYNEYVYTTDGGFELIGDTAPSLDGYAKNADVDSKITSAFGSSSDSASSKTVYGIANSAISTAKSYTDSKLTEKIPTKTSQLTNDSGFLVSNDLSSYAKTADVNTELSKKANVSDIPSTAGLLSETIASTTYATITQMNEKLNKTSVATINDNDITGGGNIYIRPGHVITVSTEDLIPNESSLEDGTFYFVYEE